MKNLRINCILTFKNFMGGQEYFDVYVSVRKNEKSAKDLLDRAFFPAICKHCSKLGRDVVDLNKISTAADWNAYEAYVGIDSAELDAGNGKFFYGKDTGWTDSWTMEQEAKFGFGANC